MKSGKLGVTVRLMGQSTDGIICYGVDFGESPPWVDDWDGIGARLEELGFDPHETDDILAHLLGGLEPFKHEDDDNPEATEAWSKARGEWADRRDQILYEHGVSLVSHCSGDCTEHILAVTGTVTSASRGYPETFNPTKMAVDLELTRGDVKLRAALTKLGVKDLEPGWLLCSMWM